MATMLHIKCLASIIKTQILKESIMWYLKEYLRQKVDTKLIVQSSYDTLSCTPALRSRVKGQTVTSDAEGKQGTHQIALDIFHNNYWYLKD